VRAHLCARAKSILGTWISDPVRITPQALHPTVQFGTTAHAIAHNLGTWTDFAPSPGYTSYILVVYDGIHPLSTASNFLLMHRGQQ
jgi:hypothetical protein